MRNKSLVGVALFLLVTLMGVVYGLSPICVMRVSASGINPVITLVGVSSGDANQSGGKINSAIFSINQTLNQKGLWPGSDFIKYDYEHTSQSVTLTVDMMNYKGLKSSEKQDIMQVVLDGIYGSDISRTAKNKIYNEICALDESTSALVRELSDNVQADFAGAWAWVKPFSGPLGILLGVIALGMFILLGLTLVVDISYITIPGVQLGLGAVNPDKPFLVSYDAVSAVKEQESKAGKEYVSPIGVYMKRKVGQLIMVFICLLYLASGQIYTLLGNMMDYFSGLLG